MGGKCLCLRGWGWREGLGMENAFRRGEGSFGDGMRGWQTMLCANQKLGSKTSRDARKSRIGWRRRWRFLASALRLMRCGRMLQRLNETSAALLERKVRWRVEQGGLLKVGEVGIARDAGPDGDGASTKMRRAPRLRNEGVRVWGKGRGGGVAGLTGSR